VKKYEARVIGGALLAGLSWALAQISGAPPEVILFGALAGSIAGGAVWEQYLGENRDRR